MKGITLISLIHGLWGLSLLLISETPFPTFGGLAPFAAYLDKDNLGMLLFITAILPLFAYWIKPNCPKIKILSILPQQFLLYWGTSWGVWQFVTQDFDVRVWLGWCYFAVFAVAHSIEASQLYSRARNGNFI